MSSKDQQSLKKSLFKLWDSTGPNLDFSNLKFVGVDVPVKISEYSTIYKFFRQYLGGNDAAVNRFKNLINETFTCEVGGYDFKFKVKDYQLVEDELIDNHIYATDLVVELLSGGTVFVLTGEKRFLLSDLLSMSQKDLEEKYGEIDEDIQYEIINYELLDVIQKTLIEEVTNKTGIEIDGINQVF
jgi:hypothetical protein